MFWSEAGLICSAPRSSTWYPPEKNPLVWCDEYEARNDGRADGRKEGRKKQKGGKKEGRKEGRKEEKKEGV